MKIAISCHPTQGGSGVVATELAMALAKRGHELHVVCYKRPFRLIDMPNIHFHQVNTTDYPLFKFPPHDLCLANKLAEVVVEHDLDIIHAHYAVPHAVSAILAREMLCDAKYHVKVVTTLHGTDITLVGSHRNFHRICRYAMIRCHGLTTVSQWLTDETVNAFDLPDDPVIIPNFVDCDHFYDKGGREYPASGEFQLLHASNFRPVKRVFDVVRTFASLRKHLPVKLTLIGDGPERGLAMELAAELGVCKYIDFTGSQVDIAQAYRDSHLFLLLSDYESFGLSALEAMACGTPVLGTRSGGLMEVIDDGQTGALRKVGDIDGFVKAALEILKDEPTWKRYSQNAHHKARDKFCRDKIVPLYEAFYQQVLDQDQGY